MGKKAVVIGGVATAHRAISLHPTCKRLRSKPQKRVKTGSSPAIKGRRPFTKISKSRGPKFSHTTFQCQKRKQKKLIAVKILEEFYGGFITFYVNTDSLMFCLY